MKNILFSLVALVSSASAPLAQCELQELLEAGGQAGDRFGYSVSLSGNLAVVGAPGADNPQADSGSARVFERGTTWVETAELAAAQPQANDNFGFSVAASGNRIIVGAPGTDGPGINAGAAYIFELQGPSWVQTARLTASNPLLRGRFGWIVDIEGETAVVGMHVEDPPVAQVVGSAYVFERTPSGWEETAILDSSNGQLEDHFGYALSLSGNRLLIGARANEAGGVQAGSAYVFERSGTAWVETATFFPAGIAEGN